MQLVQQQWQRRLFQPLSATLDPCIILPGSGRRRRFSHLSRRRLSSQPNRLGGVREMCEHAESVQPRLITINSVNIIARLLSRLALCCCWPSSCFISLHYPKMTTLIASHGPPHQHHARQGGSTDRQTNGHRPAGLSVANILHPHIRGAG